MIASRLRENGIKGLMLFSLFTIISLKSCVVSAQSTRGPLDEMITKKVKAWDDSVKRLKHSKSSPVYIGGELSMAFPQYTLKSKIAALDGLRVNYIGTNLGGVIGGAVGKVKANVGLYYSEPSAYTTEMLQAAIAGNLYILRINKANHHSFEPYVTLGFARQQTKFYGNYLPSSDNGIVSPTNYSVTDQPLVGKTGFTQMNTGVGVEYQLESCNTTFVHLFAEVGYGVLISSNASNHAFAGTRSSNPTTISLGINFGILK